MQIKTLIKVGFHAVVFSFIIATLFSCSSTKKIKYFQDIPDSGALSVIPKADYIEPKIQVDDILSIVIQTIDPEASALVNSGNVVNASTGKDLSTGLLTNGQGSAGYLVDKDGNIELPVIGKIKVSGLSTLQAKEVIRIAASKQFKVQSVIVRFANFKVSVTGEVNKPGTYVLPNEKVSIMDALALAGDLSIYGKRDNVLLIRENLDGTKTPYRINLNKSEVFSSSYYYLRQNDIIYVEPSKSKSASVDANQARTYTLIGSLLSVLIVLASRL